MWPGVATAASVQPLPETLSPSARTRVGGIARVEGGVGARAGVLERERRAADDGSAGHGLERSRGGAVVAVGVGAQDRRHRPPGDRGGERGEVRGIVGPGIDHREIGRADQIGLRARVGEGRGIGRQHAGDQLVEHHRHAGRGFRHAAKKWSLWDRDTRVYAGQRRSAADRTRSAAFTMDCSTAGLPAKKMMKLAIAKVMIHATKFARSAEPKSVRVVTCDFISDFVASRAVNTAER